ncbi:16620_t:CDS:2, partial [Gigaspora rosea]
GGETILGIITTLRRRLNNTHKHEGIVRANAITKRKNLRGNKHDEILEQNMAKRQKNKSSTTSETTKKTRFITNNSSMVQPSEVKEMTQEPPKSTNKTEPM